MGPKIEGLPDSHRSKPMCLYKEGIQQVREALEIHERLGDAVDQANRWGSLAKLLSSDGQLDAAEEAESRAFGLLPEKGEEFLL
jgi:tetratricopeptide (TPR) repeat protein